ncbi:EAL domain-containing protein [Piscinibacter sp.]|uniref:EAL domain-containing protein n=1 Tax=Piscinibacter sp. TaxID=1903157 RepID=UPI002B71EE07|nr:EAL domain-containing protein [Albitalea sp.]HUG21664.1 EAL domain-containing protein [Albitalea sp.]
MTVALLPETAPAATLAHSLFVQALDASNSATVLCDVRLPGMPVIYANPAFCALCGCDAAELLGHDRGLLHGAETDPKALAEIRRAVAAGEAMTAVLRSHRADGRAFWDRLSVAPIGGAHGPTHYAFMHEDVSEHISKDFGLQLLLDAHDAAADAGRSFITRRIDAALADHRVTGRQHALFEVRVQVAADGGEIDPLQLEGISATLAAQLRNLIPARASMSRLANLRFAVIMPLIGSDDEAEMTATGLLAELPIPLECRSQPIQLAVSAGIALLPRDGDDCAALLAAVADAAERGLACAGEPLQFVAAGLNQGRVALRLLEFDLHNALAKSQFRLVFQPQVHLSTGNVVGFEALLRWQHPVRGAISPAEFIPVVEGCGMASVVTRWVLEQSVAQLRAWEDLGHHGLQMAVNVPPSVFERSEVDRFLLDLLARYEIAGNQIELELTERTLTDASPLVFERLQALRGQGVSVAIDDFGTGYSNLSYLTRLPLDCLKIDLSFVHGAISNPSDAMVARMTCELARALKLHVVVEGIETEGQLQFFSNLRCEMAQGYLFARPLEVADATALLQSGRVFQRSPQPQQHARHLLLLDDEPNILRSLRRVFRAQTCTIHTATTPDEAFELLARHPVGVVMSDQRMPLMRGTDFLARVKRLYPDTVRIVLSGYTELQSVTDAINEGAIYKFLTKPWNDLQLNDEIEQAFRQHEMVAESQLLQQRLRESNKQLESRLQHNEERLQREEAALDVTHEALGVVPVPILGIDASGMIALSNAAADALLGGGVSVVGAHVADVLPPELADRLENGTRHGLRLVRIGDAMYDVRCNDLGAASRGMGTVITLLQGATA